jgi:hypothetical protein
MRLIIKTNVMLDLNVHNFNNNKAKQNHRKRKKKKKTEATTLFCLHRETQRAKSRESYFFLHAIEKMNDNF